MKTQKRIQNPKEIDPILIETELKAGKLVIVQFSDKLYTDQILHELNELCLKYDDNFSIRFYGHYKNSFDCNTLLKLPNVKALWLDCLLKADNLNVLTELQNLKRLSLGIYELKETEIFNTKNLQKLEKLIIGETKTKALNLEYLNNYVDLNYLILSGQTKNIEVIGSLTNLKYLGLNSISKVSLDFINKLENLKSLRFVLGGRENLDEIGINSIETLHIVRVRAFNSFRNIANFVKLKRLLIEDQIQLSELQFSEKLTEVEELTLINCKTLNSLTGLKYLKSLNLLKIIKTNISFEEHIKQSFPEKLEKFTFLTGKTKIDKEIKEHILKLGYKEK